VLSGNSLHRGFDASPAIIGNPDCGRLIGRLTAALHRLVSHHGIKMCLGHALDRIARARQAGRQRVDGDAEFADFCGRAPHQADVSRASARR